MSKSSNKLETWGNESTMNMNAILYQNILASPYFKSLYDKKTFHEIVDEIYNEVSYLAPFIKGTAPSTAFCCLFKMWTLRLTVKQIENLIDHADSPYIRAVGFLYLRYVCAPAQLWDWFSYYLDDEEEFDMTGGARAEKCTIGKLVRMLITDQKFQGTMLPRIPVPIARDLAKKLEEYDRETRDAPRGEVSDEGDRGQNRSANSDRRRDYRDDRDDRKRDDHRSSSSRHSYRSRSRERQRHRYNDDDDYYRRRRRSPSPSRRHNSDRRRRSRSRSPSRDRRRY